MIQVVCDMFFDQYAQLFDIYDESGHRIGGTFYGDVQGVIMPVPILIGAFAKNSYVFRLRPFTDPKFVGRIEFFYPCNIDHIVAFFLEGAKVRQRSEPRKGMTNL